MEKTFEGRNEETMGSLRVSFDELAPIVDDELAVLDAMTELLLMLVVLDEKLDLKARRTGRHLEAWSRRVD